MKKRLTRMLVDHTATKFVFVSEISDSQGMMRRYYVARKTAGRLMIIVCRDGLDLFEMIGKIADTTIGWDAGTIGFVQEDRIGRQHSKLTIFRILYGENYDLTLNQVFNRAPSCETPESMVR